MRVTRICEQRQLPWDIRGIIRQLSTLMKRVLVLIVVEMDKVDGVNAGARRGLENTCTSVPQIELFPVSYASQPKVTLAIFVHCPSYVQLSTSVFPLLSYPG